MRSLLPVVAALTIGGPPPRSDLTPSDAGRFHPPDAGGATTPAARGARQRGVALGLFAEDVSFSYSPLLEEIAALGATHVALIVPLYQTDARSSALHLHTRLSPSLGATAEAVRAARRAGLEVTLFPIVRLESPRPGEWRGTLAPSDRAAWFDSYQTMLGDLAALAAATGASRLVVGSELSTLDTLQSFVYWRPLLARVRALFPGPLVYSANWDHYQDADLFQLVDELGVVGYFNLREKDGPADVQALTARWRALRTTIEGWLAGRNKPFVFSELGYRSRAGSTAAPWDEGGGGAVDLDEQRRGFAAFRAAWLDPNAPSSLLDGLYVWNWYGYGGPGSGGYTPRGKPARQEIERLLRDL
jgi:hypothetical protein